MIFDVVAQLHQYLGVIPSAIDLQTWLQQTDWSQVADGTVETPMGFRAFVQTAPSKTESQSLEKFECHDQHIDLQVLLEGAEQMAWRSRLHCHAPKGDYNLDKDVRFFSDAPEHQIYLHPMQFVLLFPNDVHAPAISGGILKKLVVKIPTSHAKQS